MLGWLFFVYEEIRDLKERFKTWRYLLRRCKYYELCGLEPKREYCWQGKYNMHCGMAKRWRWGRVAH